MVNNSNNLMTSQDSYYSTFYEADAKYRNNQNLTDPKEAAKVIANIISKSRIKPRYKVAVPMSYNIAIHFPDFVREYFMKRR